MTRLTGRFLAGAGFLCIAVLTLVPLPEQTAASRLTPLWCLVCGEYGGIDVVDNILLFLPFAIGLKLTGLPTRAIVLTGLLVSFGVELLQWKVITGRDASLSDVLTNTLGTWLGAVIGGQRTRFLQPGRGQAIRLAASAAAAWLAAQTATAALLQPWTPPGGLSGRWAPSEAGRPAYDGRVISAAVGGEPWPADSAQASPGVASKIRNGAIDVAVELTSGKRFTRWSTVLELVGTPGVVLAIEALGKDLVFQPPLRSSELRLRRPSLRLAGALLSPGSRVSLNGGIRRSVLWAEWTTAGIRHQASQMLSPSFGWSLLTPFRYAYGPEARFVTVLWIGAWLFPVGYWTAGVHGRPFLSWAALGLVVVLGLGLIPLLLGYRLVHWSEWLAAGLGIGAGSAGHRGVAYFQKKCDSRSIKESS
jgi:VanZ like protein